ncbi:hypothetical protein [Streptomyces sp. SID10815]|uniref:hypothetical protein n=1 Tax=Streptomyces sp. SID10815 TaxID=2706027 RepID=UPI0013CD0336|nr:hypothetical protein [Streptomyces sp. SID10815]NEA48013.1 hypothetical protein [Streptomyces sp. SID10815]
MEGREEELAWLRAENGRLRKAEKEWELEREILRRAAACFRQGDEVKTRRWDFVSAHAETFGVQRICRVLRFSRSGYYR